jgi:hypothetical protein
LADGWQMAIFLTSRDGCILKVGVDQGGRDRFSRIFVED